MINCRLFNNRFLILLALSGATTNIFATTQTSDSGAFYWPSRISAEASGGTIGMAKGDGMVPLYGDNNNSFFFNAQAKYGNDSNWGGAAGLGFRHIYHDARILGAYLFADGSRFTNDGDLDNETFWFLNPGVESLGNLFDLRLNGYIPVSSQQETVGSTTGITFSGHSQFNTVFDTINSTGPGVDGEVGAVKIPYLKHLRAYVGGYHFQPKDQDNITGISGRVEYPLTHYVALTAVDTYDNEQHNTFQVGLRLTLGGRKDDVSGQTIERRIVDPINRNLATQYTGSDVPVIVSQKVGSSTPTLNGIYFFTSNGGMAFDPAQGTNNCTYEHPCSSPSFSQTTVNDIASFTPNANLYFNPGVYSLGSQLGLPNGQSLYGRTEDYTQAASGNQRAQFNGGISLGGNNLLDSIAIINRSSTQPIAVNISGVNDININNVLIDSETTPSTDINIVGLNLSAAKNVNITNSEILSNTNIASGLSVLVYNLSAVNSQFNVSDSILSQNINTAATIAFNGVINLGGKDTANIDNTQILANVNQTGTGFVTAQEFGVFIVTDDQLTMDNSQVNVNVNVFNPIADGVVNTGGTMTIKNSILSAESNTSSNTFPTFANSFTVQASSGTTNLINDQINANSNSFSSVAANTQSVGIILVGSSVVNLSDSTLNISSHTSGTSSGLSASTGISNSATLNLSGTNAFNLNATGSTPTFETIIN